MKTEVVNQIFYDCHCHILPGLDDGARNLEETKQLLLREYAEGIRTIIATPHFRPSQWKQNAVLVNEAFLQTRRLAAHMTPDLNIYLWNEAYWEDGLIYHFKNGDCKTLGNGYVLVESNPNCSEETLYRMVELLTLNNYTPVFAHIERYQVVKKKRGIIDNLKDAGAWIQVDSDSIAGKNGFFTAVFCRKLLKKQKIDLIGTDCHRIDFRPPEFRQCVKYIQENTSQDYFNLLMQEKPEKLLKREKYHASDATTMV